MAKDRNFFEDEGEERGLRNLWRSSDGQDESRGRRPAWTVGALVLAAALFSAVVWFSYPDSDATRDALSAPVIRADTGAYRIAPDSPGGMEIANRESTIFDAMRGRPGARTVQDPPVENLLAAEDGAAPVPRERLFAGLNTEKAADSPDGADAASPAPGTQGQAPQTEELLTMQSALSPHTPPAGNKVITLSAAEPGTQTPQTAAPQAQKLAASSDEKIQNALEQEAKDLAKTEPAAGLAAPVSRIVEKADRDKETKPAAAAKPAVTASRKPASGSYYIQIASVPSRGGAPREWKVLQAKYSDLKPLSMRVQEANLGPKGTFYRIQAGPMAKADAQRICNAIKARKPGGCLVVGP